MVTINVTDVDEAGTVALSMYTTLGPYTTHRHIDRPGWQSSPATTIWQWAKADAQDGNLFRHNRCYVKYLHARPDGDVGKFLKATASYTDDHGPNKSEEATTTSAVQSGTNRPPDFGATSTTRDVAENTAADQPVGDPVEATDADSDTLTYSLVSGGDAGLFDIDTSTGQIKVKTGTTLDYEGLRKSYIVSVEVTDSKSADGAANTATDDSIAVTINVTDVEEAGVVTLSNSRPPARVEITATLADPDGGVTDTTWQWAKTLDPANNPWTDINGATSASYTPPDTDLTYYLRATASYTDRRGIDKKAEKETTAAVGAGANRPPDFGATTATRSFPENSAANVNVGNPVTATDLDTGNTPEYSLDATGATLFDIDSTSGQIKTKSGVTYDHETTPSYSVTVTADDKNGGTDTIDVTIDVTDVNEKPEFPSTETGDRSIPENTVAGQPIGDPVEADDPENDSLTYSLSGTDVADFTIVTMSGQLQTKSALDNENKATYEVTVSVHDGKNEAEGSDTTVDDTIDVTITVTGENDPPTVSGQTTVNHAENDAGTVATYTATDPEGVTSFTWTLSGDDADDFAINEGALTFSSTPNFEAATDNDNDNIYLVTVEASDGTVKGTLDVTVTVTGVNEDPAFNEGPTTTRIVSENTGTNQDIGNPIAATDPDDGDTLIYSLDSTSAATFSIDTSNGQLKTKAALNKEATATYTVIVSVKDIQTDAIPDDTITVTITVTDANEPPEFPSTEDGTRSFPENTGANVNVGSAVTANDPDTGATLTYTLEGADAASFEIDDTNGQIKTKAGVTYDHEATPSYSVTVTADDNNGGTDTIDVTINVTDVDEPPLKPGTPTVSRVSNTAVSVTWTAPDNTGRPPILHYQYQYKKTSEQLGSGEPFSTSGPTTSDTISTLDAGTSYDVQVWAVNAEGPGQWSDAGTGSTNSPPCILRRNGGAGGG